MKIGISAIITSIKIVGDEIKEEIVDLEDYEMQILKRSLKERIEKSKNPEEVELLAKISFV